jgi:hypothetical protein
MSQRPWVLKPIGEPGENHIYTSPGTTPDLGFLMPTTCQSSLLLCSLRGGGERNEKNLYKLSVSKAHQMRHAPELDTCLGSSFGSGALIWGNASLLGPLTLHLSQWRNAPAAARLGLLVLLDPFWFESSFTNCIIEYCLTRVKLASTHCGRIWP